ncbi:MAG: hypothetical protein AAGK21_12965 [Bacteroidota bacterium]
MVTDPLIQLARRYVDLSAADVEQITSTWEASVPVEPGQTFLRPGQTCNALRFQDEGYSRFFAETDASDITRHFVPPGTLFTVVASYYPMAPSREGLQALTQGHIRTLSRESNGRLSAEIPAWAAFRRSYVREVYAYLDETLDTLRSKTAGERYEAFERDQPDILLNVPLRHVASYLGMTPQSLSRVRTRR